MRIHNKIAPVALAMLVGFCSIATEAQAQSKIGIIDVRRLVTDSAEGKEVLTTLQQLSDDKSSQLRSLTEELEQLHLEVSALTAPREVGSYKEIKIGRDGVVLVVGRRQAVYLPQVAPEQGWDVAETLTHLSQKAGLAADAWRGPKARFLTFQAEVFEE